MSGFSEADERALAVAFEDEEQGGVAFRDFVLEELNRLGDQLAADRAELQAIRVELDAQESK